MSPKISLILVLFFGLTMQVYNQECNCDHILPQQHLIDGIELGYQAGDTICLDANVDYGSMHWTNILGEEGNPITFINCGGKVVINPQHENLSFLLKTTFSEHLRITGTGNSDTEYGIELNGLLNDSVEAHMGVSADLLTTNIEIDHLEVHQIGFAGIMAKSDPNCKYPTERDSFTIYNVRIHHNYVHHTGGEGMYIGNSFYANGRDYGCGVALPHAIHGCYVYHNRVEYTGWDGIQVGSATKNAEIHHNVVRNVGLDHNFTHGNGIQLGGGTGGLCYNNYIENSINCGIIVLGLGNNVIYNNIMVNPGRFGSFIDTRPPAVEGSGFVYVFNTILNPEYDAIRIYATDLEKNVIKNNILVNPGNYEEYEADNTWKTGEDAYIRLKNSTQNNVEQSNNLKVRSEEEVFFEEHDGVAYALAENSPAVNAALPLPEYGIEIDFFDRSRTEGEAPDIGAIEYRPETITGIISEYQKNLEPNIRLYPNPTDGMVYIQSMGMEIKKLCIFDAMGRFVSEIPANKNGIDLSAFNGNIFFIQAVLNTGVVYQKLIRTD